MRIRHGEKETGFGNMRKKGQEWKVERKKQENEIERKEQEF